MRLRTPDAQAPFPLAGSAQTRSRGPARGHAHSPEGSAPIYSSAAYEYARESSEEEREREIGTEKENGVRGEKEREGEREREIHDKLDTQPDPLRLTCVCCLRPCRLSASPLHLASPLQRPSSTGSTTRPLLRHVYRDSSIDERVSQTRIYTGTVINMDLPRDL